MPFLFILKEIQFNNREMDLYYSIATNKFQRKNEYGVGVSLCGEDKALNHTRTKQV